jgi:hypothetical protein
MNRYIAAIALFAVAVNAMDDEDHDDHDHDDTDGGSGDSTMDSVSSWFSARQEPVAFTSIATADPCMLDGTYGWFQLAGVQQVFIGHTVSGCDIPDGARVLSWAEIEDPETPGNVEGFYCTIEFDQSEDTAMGSADLETQTGTDIDYASWNEVVRTDWCKQTEGSEDNSECTRQSASSWQKLALNAEENYPISYDVATSKGSATCTGRRMLDTPNAYMAIKSGAYSVKSGYKIYNNVADYDGAVVAMSGNGSAQEFMFEGAATLFAGAAMLTASLLA